MESEIDYWRLNFDLYIDVKKLSGGWWVYLDYNVSSGPFLSYEIEIGDGPGPELDNYTFYLFLCTIALQHCPIYYEGNCSFDIYYLLGDQ